MIEKFLWFCFYLNLLVVALFILFDNNLAGLNIDLTSPIKSLMLILPVVMMFLHSSLTLSFKRGLIFIFLASVIGFTAEVLGINTGTIFGGYYLYSSEAINIAQVPISVIAFWAVFIYLGYSLSNSFLYWLNQDKHSKKQSALAKLVGLVLLDGFLIVAIDLLMDPLQVKAGNWRWLEGGEYFGVPIGNFVGWFLVAIIITGIYRLTEFFYPQNIKINKKLFIIPVINYLILYLSFAASALKVNLTSLFIIGSFLMLPPVVFNLYLFKAVIKQDK